MNEREPFSPGNDLLLIDRVGYFLGVSPGRTLEAGLTVRALLGPAFREYPGVSIRPTQQIVTAADSGGELLIAVTASLDPSAPPSKLLRDSQRFFRVAISLRSMGSPSAKSRCS